MAPSIIQEKKVGSITIYPKTKKEGSVRGIDVFGGIYGGNHVTVKRIEREILNEEIQLSCQDVSTHENIALYFAKEETEDFTYLAMEMCAGNLESLIKGELQGPTIDQALCEMARGVHELHVRGYVHGNLKPRNVLIAQLEDERSVIKLADFQYRKEVASPTDDGWRAPEAHESTTQLNKAGDVFSLGCLFCFALTNGCHPFGEESVRLDNIEAGKIDCQVLEKIDDPALRKLVRAMVSQDPNSRPCIQKVISDPAIAPEKNTASQHSFRIPRTGTPIGESASVGVEVYEARVDNRIRAIKKINVLQYRTNYSMEVNNLTMPSMSNCPYLVRYFSHEKDAAGNFCYIEMERCIASLSNYIHNKQFVETISDRQKRRLFQKNIVEGVSFLHGINLVHRDIKPSNILICEHKGRLIPKITDYGISVPAASEGYQSTELQRGTDGWRAPEINSKRRFSVSVDCFALGCLLFYIETNGDHPFNHYQPNAIGRDTQRNIDKYIPNLALLLPIEATLQDIICKALEKEPKERISAEKMLVHPAFFTNKEALEFLREVDEQIKTTSELDDMFERFDKELAYVVIDDNWTTRLENIVLQEVATGPKGKPNKKITSNSKHGTSVSNLLHLIRNKLAHFSELREETQQFFGQPPDKYFEYWHNKFPYLLISIWNVTKKEKLHKLILEILALKKEKPVTQKKRTFERIKSLFSGSTECKTGGETFNAQTKPFLAKKKSYFELLTDFPLEVKGRLGASHDLQNTKKEIIYRLRHRLEIGVSDAGAPLDENHNKRSTYEALLELIDDYDPSAICEIFQLLLESRFTVPLFNPLKNDSHLALFGDIQLNAVPNEPPITLGCDTRLSRVVLASRRSLVMSQSLDLLTELFSLDTLHHNDLFDKSLTNERLIADIGVGYIRCNQEKHHVLVVHVVGEFEKAAEFINDFADVLLVEDTSSEEKSLIQNIRGSKKDLWIGKSMLALLWRPGTATGKPEPPFQSVEMQYGSRLFRTLADKMVNHFNNNRRLDRKELSKLKILGGKMSTLGYPISTMADLLNSPVATRRKLELQRNFRQQAVYEENLREHRLNKDICTLYDEKINGCIALRKQLALAVGEIPLLLHFCDMLREHDQGRRVTEVRRLEQRLCQVSEAEVQMVQGKIEQLHSQLLRSNISDSDAERLKEEYQQAKNNERESVLHVEHLWRELSHLYVVDPLKYEDAPKLAAQHLLDGFSVELLDGDANLLNFPWIKSVFDNLGRLMETSKRRIFVLSVMGVQSSGKSTLLNTMFGIKLRTSVGQCTRGINMQLVPVSGRNEYDYVLILDTEGMRSPDYHGMEGSEKRDNQMATLSILLADATVVVNPGENDTAIKEVLPVVLMAYERSKLAEKRCARLSSMMFFVYNRIDTTQRGKLSNIVQTLNQSLNEAFRTIGSSFGSERCLFRDFYLDATNSSRSDVRILGNNKKSFDPPDNVPDPTYGVTLAEFREHIHRRVTCGSPKWKAHSPRDLSTYLGNIWECVCSADFSIQFKNVLDKMAFDKIEAEYQEIERKLVSRYRKRFADVQSALEKEASLACPADAAPNNPELYANLQVRLKDAMNSVITNLDERFSRAVEQPGRDQWRSSYEQRWTLCKGKQEEYWCRQLRYSYDANVTYEFQVEELKNEMRKKINADIVDKGPSSLTAKELRSNFELMMNEFVEKAKSDCPPLEVNKCVDKFYAASAIIRSHQISLDSKDLALALKNALSKHERRHMNSDFLGSLSKHWPSTTKNMLDDITSLLKKIQDAIGSRLESVRCYDDGVVSNVIKDTDKAIDESKAIEYRQRELAHAFARRYLIYRMERIQKTWEARNLVWAKFDHKTNRQAMWEYYRMASQGAAKIKLFALLLSNKFEHLHKAYKAEVAAISHRAIKRKLANNHWAPGYMDSHLVEVLQSNQPNYLIYYAKKPSELQIRVLQQLLEENVQRTMSNTKTWKHFVSQLYTCVSRATDCAVKPGRGTRAGRFVTTLRTGLARFFVSNVLAKSIDRNLSANFDELDEMPESEFRKECDGALKGVIRQQCDPRETYGDFVSQVMNVAISELRERGGLALRCQHCCPCCGSMCIREAGHSASAKHDTKHQPAGLVGWKLNDGTLDWRTCYDLRPEDNLVRGSLRFHFSDWAVVFPEWERPPNRLGNRNALQEYIFHHYQKEIAQHYKAKPCNKMPPQYKRNRNDVIREVYAEMNISGHPSTTLPSNRGIGRKKYN